MLSSWTHVESGESRSLHDEGLVADGILWGSMHRIIKKRTPGQWVESTFPRCYSSSQGPDQTRGDKGECAYMYIEISTICILGCNWVTFWISFAAVALFGIKIGTPCIGACCVEYYILDIFAKWWLRAHVNQKQLLSVSSAFKECGLVVSCWHWGYTSL